MNCKAMEKNASLYVDGMLSHRETYAYKAHLDACALCSLRVRELEELKSRLSGLRPVFAPTHLKNLLDNQIECKRQQTLVKSTRSAVDDVLLTLRRLDKRDVFIGLLALPITIFFFLSIFAQMYISGARLSKTPKVIAFIAPVGNLQPAIVDTKVSNPRFISETPPNICSFHLISFVQSAYPGTSQEDSFAVMAHITKNGQAKIEEVIQYPENNMVLKKLDSMINKIPFKPATLNGKSVDSHLILAFSKINVAG